MSGEFARRTFLCTPGSSLKMMEKTRTSNTDTIVLDLEDGVSLLEKDDARKNVANIMDEMKATGKEVLVRINSVDTHNGIQDLLTLIPEQPHGFIIPKATEKLVMVADTILNAEEEALGLEIGRIKLTVVIETAYGVINAYNILKASERVNAAQLGGEDLAKELGVERTKQGDEIRYGRNAVIYAAHACGIDVIDTPYTALYDPKGLEEDTFNAKLLGATGKSCIHPAHIDTINRIFSPKEEEIKFAEDLLEAFDKSIKEGKGACMFCGKMIDAPIAEKARKLIEKANVIKNNEIIEI